MDGGHRRRARGFSPERTKLKKASQSSVCSQILIQLRARAHFADSHAAARDENLMEKF
jgi:hypothetical protein